MIGTACKNCSEKRTDWSLLYWKVQLFQKQKRTNMLIKVGSLQDLATPAIPPYPSAERKTFCHLFSNRFLGGFQSTIIIHIFHMISLVSFRWALDLNYCGTNWKNMEKGPPTLSIFNNISQVFLRPRLANAISLREVVGSTCLENKADGHLSTWKLLKQLGNPYNSQNNRLF